MKTEHNLLIKESWAQIRKTKKRVILKAFFIGIIFYFGYSITFVEKKHQYLLNWEPYATHKKEYQKILSNTNNSFETLIDDLNKKGLYDEAKNLSKILENKEQALKSYHKKKRNLKSSFSYFGYESKNIFWHEFGGALFSFILASFVLILICNPNIITELKTFLILGTLGFLYVSFFWIYHSLFIKSDYGNWAYNISYIVCAVVSTILVFLLIIYFNYKETEKRKMKEALNRLANNGNELLNLLK